MPVLVFFIILSFSFYFYYKVKSVRSSRFIEKKWLSGKSSIALGLFVALFGINQLFLFQTTFTYIVAALFILIGLGSAWMGWKVYKHFLPQAVKEAQELDNQ
ncbi:YtpI family protein [Rossellomorea vietnamensis]|uniref:YtpI family protein n=1 Tax=Rossellomorea vietnamensis TaxID=218284 RepID=UPI003CF1BD9A